MKDDINDKAIELITRHLAGESSAVDEKELFDWIRKSPENSLQFEDYKRVFTLSENHYTARQAQNLPINIDEEWNHFAGAMALLNDPPIRTLQPVRASYSNTFYKLAAAVLVLIVSGFIINYFLSKDKELNYQTAENTRTVSLPDGSTINMNRNSRLTYTSSFGEVNRTVTLQGEAFFEVAHNPQKPFIIQVHKTQVEVVGTSFNIRAYNDEGHVEVIVKTGVVKFYVPELKKEVKLTAGQKGDYDNQGKQVNNSVNEDINFMAWNTQEIIFEETDLHTVIETLHKTFGVNITMAPSIPASCVVTVTFNHQTLDAILHVLETTLNLTYRRTGNQIEITQAGC